jgi:glycosyltransferase involved in cell wall biosynthesis
MSPRITFITPTYNAAATIEDTIRSVKKEAARFDFEHRFIDGGSTDDTIAIIRRLKGPNAQITCERDDGVYDAMNKGLEQARGEWVAILNADDYYLPGALEAIMAAADKPGSADIICGEILVQITDRGERRRPTLGWRGRLGIWHPLWHPAVFVKRAVYERFGGYNARYRVAADQDFFFRLLDRNETVECVPTVVTVMRAGGLSTKFYDLTTMELLEIHRSRQGIIGRLSHILFYFQPRLRNHTTSPHGIRYCIWALRDLIRPVNSVDA